MQRTLDPAFVFQTVLQDITHSVCELNNEKDPDNQIKISEVVSKGGIRFILASPPLKFVQRQRSSTHETLLDIVVPISVADVWSFSRFQQFHLLAHYNKI